MVPADYVNNNMTQNFTLPTLGTSNWYTPAQVSALTIKVQTAGGALVGGARVAISGGAADRAGRLHRRHDGHERRVDGPLHGDGPVGLRLHADGVGAGDERAAHRAEHHNDGHEDDYRLMTRRMPVARPGNHDGFTVIELVISMVLIGAVFTIFSITMSSTIRNSTEVQEDSVLQGEVRATVDALAKDLRQAYTGNGTPALETMTGTQIQFLSPDRATPFHLRRIAYRLASGRIERASATSTNTGQPPWTFPALSPYAKQVGSVDELDRVHLLERRRPARADGRGERRRERDDHRHRRDRDVAEPEVHLRDERRPAGDAVRSATGSRRCAARTA